MCAEEREEAAPERRACGARGGPVEAITARVEDSNDAPRSQYKRAIRAMPTLRRVLSALLVTAFGCTAPPRVDTAPAAAAAPAADAAPPAPPAKVPDAPGETLGKEARARYRVALAEGRELHRKGEYRPAIAAFERALAIDPDDPRALAELGWAAFFAGDLELAEDKTRAALQRSADAKNRGAALYNLGRIAEQRGQRADAIARYQESLRERPNDAVRERLARLDAGVARAREVLTPAPLRGPFASLKAFCAGREARDAVASPCDPEAPFPAEVYEGPTELARGWGPILAARVLWTAGPSARTPEAEVLVHLAIRTEQGWFVSEPVADIYNPGAFGIHASLTATALELADLVAGGPPELVYRFVLGRDDSDMGLNEIESTSARSLVICGIGPSGAPSCTGALPLEVRSERSVFLPEEDEPGVRHEGLFNTHYTITETIAPEGGITLASADDLPEALRPLLGTRPLRFP